MISVNLFEEKAKKLIAFLKETFDQEELLNISDQDQIVDTSVPTDSFMQDDAMQVDAIQQDISAEVPIEKPPKFRIYWRAWKEGNSTAGQTESNLETAQMARAEAMTKLYDLGFNDIEILAIETIQNTI